MADEQPLSGQQIAAMQKQMAEKLAVTIKDVDLRKWSIDQACGIAGASLEHKGNLVDVVKTAREIHAFLTEEAKP